MTGRRHVGYYVHHAGSGHRHRALALAGRLAQRGVEVTGLGSLPRPADWPGGEDRWVRLEADDEPAPGDDAEATAHGLLHWAPLGHRGLSRRAAQLSAWLDATRPGLLVSDVSQEVSLLARLHGVRVASVLLPGHRDDRAHALGLGVSDAVVGFWPASADGMTGGLPADVASRVQALGGQSRFAPVTAPRRARSTGAGHLVVLAGTGGGAEPLVAAAEAAMRGLPGWTCRVLGGPGAWVEEPFAALCEADVVLTHAGQNALAEVAAARVPAVVVPQPRPFAEQVTTGRVLAVGDWPVVVVEPDDVATADGSWSRVVERAADLDGDRWAPWVDGAAAERFADVVGALLGAPGPTPGPTPGPA
jgi:UDP:flavonoid glycosyltransferase YjiC (YdhE family)